METKQLPISVEIKNRIPLEFEKEKYRIPFFIEVQPYKKVDMYPAEEEFEKLKYFRFPTEEYIAQGFYEILNKLELLNNLSWYKEIYDIILVEAVDGRRVRDCFGKLLESKKIPSLEKRLDTIKSYENYGYMKKKWKNEKKRQSGEFPEWNEVVSLLVTFSLPYSMQSFGMKSSLKIGCLSWADIYRNPARMTLAMVPIKVVKRAPTSV